MEDEWDEYERHMEESYEAYQDHLDMLADMEYAAIAREFGWGDE